jgi:hypothetical protein
MTNKVKNIKEGSKRDAENMYAVYCTRDQVEDRTDDPRWYTIDLLSTVYDTAIELLMRLDAEKDESENKDMFDLDIEAAEDGFFHYYSKAIEEVDIDDIKNARRVRKANEIAQYAITRYFSQRSIEHTALCSQCWTDQEVPEYAEFYKKDFWEKINKENVETYREILKGYE